MKEIPLPRLKLFLIIEVGGLFIIRVLILVR